MSEHNVETLARIIGCEDGTPWEQLPELAQHIARKCAGLAVDAGWSPPGAARAGDTLTEAEHGWPFGTDAACLLIAAAGNPNERIENRDSWAVTMPQRPDVFRIEALRARERLEQAISHVAAEVARG